MVFRKLSSREFLLLFPAQAIFYNISFVLLNIAKRIHPFLLYIREVIRIEMRLIKLMVAFICSGLIFISSKDQHVKESPSILIFSKTAGFYHECISEGNQAIMNICELHGIKADTTSHAKKFTKENLSRYDAVLFFNTTGDVLNRQQEIAFEHFIQSGRGYIGVHAASDTEYDWSWYGQLAGAYFISHPKIQKAKFIVQDTAFIATAFLPQEWLRTDELYNLKVTNSDVNVVLTVDESSYDGGENGEFHPMAWYHAYDGGRAFYTALGHTKESYKEAHFMKHLLGGIQYAIGKDVKQGQ